MYKRPSIRFFVPLILIGLMASFGCAAATTGFSNSNVKRFRATLERITPDGFAAFTNGYNYALAGIRMRSVEETKESELLDVVHSIVFEKSAKVEVEQFGPSGFVMVYYQQRVTKPNWYGWQVLMPAQYVRGSVNELLIAMGAAEFDPSGGLSDLSETAANKLQDVAAKAQRSRRSHEMRGHARQVYRWREGYQPRRAANLN